jgi:hypothetical protein
MEESKTPPSLNAPTKEQKPKEKKKPGRKKKPRVPVNIIMSETPVVLTFD